MYGDEKINTQQYDEVKRNLTSLEVGNREVSPVLQAFHQQDKALDELSGLTHDLTDRLQPALLPEPPTANGESDPNPRPSSALVQEINSKTRQITRQSERIRAILQRIEL